MHSYQEEPLDAAADEPVFSHRNRMRMAFWAIFLLAAWSVLFFGFGLAQRAFDSLEQTPDDPSGYQVVRYGRGEPKARAATAADMQREKYRGVVTLAVYGSLSGVAVFLLVTALVDYRTRFLGWAIHQLPRG
jgi:hypothetical protein